MVKMILPKLETHALRYVCQLDSTPVLNRINGLPFKKLFGHLIQTLSKHIGLWARRHEV